MELTRVKWLRQLQQIHTVKSDTGFETEFREYHAKLSYCQIKKQGIQLCVCECVYTYM